MDMYRVLARSMIVVNRHIRAAKGYANNMPMFEATGVGALLITERSPNLGELLEPGREVLAYGCAEELIELIEYYLADPIELGRIAEAGHYRTLAAHDYRRRIGELAERLEDRLHRKR
jgi:spore maturation protein CgeB